ncbi:hypothetical protein DSO57_1008088 [Entomophthora muscae]|uniref:Uncharacterized protein n=1 Tax=Entomophthora muscae TaxID=34485 RepID=A0ACC2RYA0_9FUNG|nr:hypothetical protein DSO57_1008088 [Entomophthora muscae]
MIFLVCLLTSLAAVYAKDFSGGRIPAYFHSSPKAISTVSDISTTLYSKPKKGQYNSARFPYTKVATPQDKVNLATVYLVGRDHKYRLQSKFAIVPQECSCYWINATQLSRSFPQLRTGNYKLSIRENGNQKKKYTVESGSFRLKINRK